MPVLIFSFCLPTHLIPSYESKTFEEGEVIFIFILKTTETYSQILMHSIIVLNQSDWHSLNIHKLGVTKLSSASCWERERERERAILKTFSYFFTLFQTIEICKQSKLFHMIQMFSNYSYFSTNLNFVYLCLSLFPFAYHYLHKMKIPWTSTRYQQR